MFQVPDMPEGPMEDWSAETLGVAWSATAIANTILDSVEQLGDNCTLDVLIAAMIRCKVDKVLFSALLTGLAEAGVVAAPIIEEVCEDESLDWYTEEGTARVKAAVIGKGEHFDVVREMSLTLRAKMRREITRRGITFDFDDMSFKPRPMAYKWWEEPSERPDKPAFSEKHPPKPRF